MCVCVCVCVFVCKCNVYCMNEFSIVCIHALQLEELTLRLEQLGESERRHHEHRKKEKGR